MKRMRDTLREPARTTPVGGQWDVIVVGGGIAGVAAAVAAARQGARVGLVEKEQALGGLATLGNVVVYLPLCDGRGHLLSGGIAEELLKLSVRDPAGVLEGIPPAWRGRRTAPAEAPRYVVRYNPATFILALDRYVVDAGVDLLFDTRFCGVVREGRQLKAVLVENKGGRCALVAKAFVDASGDADVCAAAGEPTVTLSTNVAAGWFYTAGASGVRLHPWSESFDLHGQNAPKGCQALSGISPADVTNQLLVTRRRIQAQVDHLRRETGEADRYPILLPTVPCFRMTRRLQAPGIEEQDNRVACADAIGLIGHWRTRGPAYAIPYRSLAAVRTDNLLVAGRCCAAGTTGWDLTRVIPACAVTGQAAGVAAALLRHGRRTVRTLDLARLQQTLRHARVPLAFPPIARKAPCRPA